MLIVDIVSLLTVLVCCAFGLYHSAFKDNLLQCLGMCVLVLACLVRIDWVWRFGADDRTWSLLLVGLAVYALGTAVKVVIHRGREKGWGMVVNFDAWMFRRKTGAGGFDSKPHHHV